MSTSTPCIEQDRTGEAVGTCEITTKQSVVGRNSQKQHLAQHDRSVPKTGQLITSGKTAKVRQKMRLFCHFAQHKNNYLCLNLGLKAKTANFQNDKLFKLRNTVLFLLSISSFVHNILPSHPTSLGSHMF